MQWTVVGRNVSRSSALEQYVEERIVRRLSGFAGGIRKLMVRARDVDTSNLQSPREVTAVVVLAGGQTIRMRQQAGDFYSAVDALADRLRHTVRKRLDRRLFGVRRQYRRLRRNQRRRDD